MKTTAILSQTMIQGRHKRHGTHAMPKVFVPRKPPKKYLQQFKNYTISPLLKEGMSYFKLVKPKRRSGWPKMDKIGAVPLAKIQLSMPGKIRMGGKEIWGMGQVVMKKPNLRPGGQ
jgi:hypothetical protein